MIVERTVPKTLADFETVFESFTRLGVFPPLYEQEVGPDTHSGILWLWFYLWTVTLET